MSLPDLLRYVYNHASDEVIRRGKKIFNHAGVQLLEHDPLTEFITFRVRNDNYNNHYKVTVQKYIHTKELSLRCQCPYNMGSVCRHEAAALFQLNDLLQTGFFQGAELDYQQQHTTVRMRQISEHFLRLFSSLDIMKRAEEWRLNNQIKIETAKDDAVTSTVIDDNKNEFSVKLVQNEDRYFDSSCNCSETRFPLCVHKVATFLLLLHKHGANYFSTLRNWDTQKNKLLSLYGYSINDDIKGKFEFAYHEGKPFLRVLDKTIKKLNTQTLSNVVAKEPIIDDQEDEQIKLGVLIRHDADNYPGVVFDLIAGASNEQENAFAGTIEKVNLFQLIPLSHPNEKEKILITALRKQSETELIKSLKRNLPFGDFMDNLAEQLHPNVISKELQDQAWDFYLPKYKQLLEQFRDFSFVYYLPEGKAYLTENIEQCNFSDDKFTIKLIVNNSDAIRLSYQILIGETTLSLSELIQLNEGLILNENKIISAENIDVVNVLRLFNKTESISISKEDWNHYLENTLLPLSTLVPIQFDESLKKTINNIEPELHLQLRETEKMLSFKPLFVYDGIEKEWLDYSNAITAHDGLVTIYPRNESAEQTFLTTMRYMHPLMQESRRSRSFLLPANEALKGGWYFSFMEKLQEANVQVSGFQTLKQMRINPYRPKTQMHFGSGIDWFDADMEIAFGDQKANIEEVKKALLKKENFVSLTDGTVGLLPDEWMQKYGMMIKLSQVKDGKLRLKKYHFSVIEQLTYEIDDIHVVKELKEKQQRLANYDFDNDDTSIIPHNINATLRPYQQAGFKWMQFLNYTSWGGILADDMGLGKTLQTLSILQQYKNEKEKVKYLVVCPTTLMYNWENEIKKFAPTITYHIYHSASRNSSGASFINADLIITTYGTLRSDIKMLSEIEFDYVVLDESQAIKNPVSQVAKATLLLQAKNKLALSGTPVQNNTFDLYSQMNFLNPGMLGSADFFRNEFANPIDKMQDADAQTELRKLIYPFLLRRTKEQVAPDLPEKTETVLFCEMGAKQRKIYDAYRNLYRSKILDEIDTVGIAKSQLSILTGLMKLRQICDSPAILNEDELYENHSVKINELVREITENTGNHKALVFSQFIGMLSLIKEELDRINVPYVYFDGSSTTTEREKAIQQFQNDESCRVFLISLKAGGVGLNLTAADYVYIVDPWWNPAVEQQAIDRTHRIGQTKNIFAYRLICKDTIEEKIMLLQQRKLNLVKGLIADENAFLKKLTKDDVAYLLS